jgi:hypothetical protein
MQQPPEGQQRPPQPPYYPPPGQQYGPQYPQQPWQQPPPPKKKRRTWLWIVLGVLAIVVLGCVGVVALASQASKTTTSTLATTIATSIPTSAKTRGTTTPQAGQKWTTVRTFSGSSSKKTPFFTVPDDWRLNWTCRGGEFGGNLTATIYGPGNAYVDLPINATCPAGKTVSDTTEEHQAGSIYLDISALSDWTIQIQELK